jgi:hypothetical protein
VLREMGETRASLCPGYRIRVVDGNHLPASAKRLAPLRSESDCPWQIPQDRSGGDRNRLRRIVQIGAGKRAIALRRIEVHLEQPSENGDRFVRILTNWPDTKSAGEIAMLYRRRWTIQSGRTPAWTRPSSYLERDGLQGLPVI